MLQKGKRSATEDIIANSKKFFPKNSKKIFFVDYIFVYNKKTKDFYSSRIDGKYFIIGSFENNFQKLIRKNQKKEIVYISTYRPYSFEQTENEDKIVLELFHLAKKNKIPLKILSRWRNKKDMLKREIKYFNNILKQNITFINSKESSYNILSKYRYVFSSTSTLAIEFLAKGGRAGLLTFKSFGNRIFEFRLGGFEGLKKRGYFWTSDHKFNKNEVKRVFDNIIKASNKIWIKKTNSYTKKVLSFEYDNKSFKKIINNI